MRFKLLVGFLFIFFSATAQTGGTPIRIDSLPLSVIDVPIQISLKPVYALAEKNVDTLFLSDGYPNGWVQPDCATRYKYRFRRTPLRISMRGTTMNLGFTGLYQITGSTRGCVSGTPVTPWTPACTCGIDDPERRVNIRFTSNFQLHSNYVLSTSFVRDEPEAIDKCSVCLWGQDVTSQVMSGLKKELDASRKLMEDSFGTIKLRPYVQRAWDMLNTPYAIPGFGYISLHPKKLRMQNISAENDLLNINIGITAAPVVSFSKASGGVAVVPNLSTTPNAGGFNIFLEAALNYDSLSAVMNGYLAGRRFDVGDGLVKKHIVVKEAKVAGDSTGKLLISVDFTGSFDGVAHFIGKPVYNETLRRIEVADLEYDLQTKSFLLRTAKWLFNKKILAELKKYTSFDLSTYYDSAALALNGYLNKEWTKGIKGNGSVSALKLTALYAMPQHLLIRSNCAGKLTVMVTEIDLAL